MAAGRALALAAVIASLALAGCGAGGGPGSGGPGSGGPGSGGPGSGGAVGTPPAGGAAGTGTGTGSGAQQAGGAAGQGMMGGGSGPAAGYHFSTLTCPAPSRLPGTTVVVRLGDMGMTSMMGGTAPLGARMMLQASPATVPAGKVSLVAENMGWRTHELVVLPLAAGQQAGQRVPGPDGTVDEQGSLGEASASCGAGPGEGIRAGTVGWVTLTLSPGRYELICNLPNHYADGMYQELQVTSS